MWGDTFVLNQIEGNSSRGLAKRKLIIAATTSTMQLSGSLTAISELMHSHVFSFSFYLLLFLFVKNHTPALTQTPRAKHPAIRLNHNQPKSDRPESIGRLIL